MFKSQLIMDYSSILLTFMQVSVAFVGFSAIIAAFQSKETLTMRKSDAVGLELIINTGLMGGFLSILPFVFFGFGLEESEVWGFCSGIVSVIYLAFIYYLFKRIHIKKFKRLKTKIIIAIYFIIGVSAMILNCLNTFGIQFDQEFTPYLIGLIYPLCLVGFMFSRFLFVPIWRRLREQEESL